MCFVQFLFFKHALVLTPKVRKEQAPGILWMHGGGYMTGMKETVGYENQGKFAKVFAKTYGVLPLEYRRLPEIRSARRKKNGS